MSQIHTLILAVAAIQGFLLFTLLISDKRVNFASKILGFHCLLIASIMLLPLIVNNQNSHFNWLLGFAVFIPASYGALSYLYCRTAMTNSVLTRFDLIHLVPLLICYVLNYEVLFSAQKAWNFVSMTPNDQLRNHTLTLTVFYGQIVIYIFLLLRMIKRYQTKAKQTLSSYNPDIFKWLWSMMLFIILIWSLKLLCYFTVVPHILNAVGDFLLMVMIYFIAIAQWRNPSLFHIQQLNAQLTEPTTSNDKKSSDGLLDQDTRSSVLSLVQEQVQDQSLYRNSELTLAMLAEQVGVSVHHLSETLNQLGGKNFNLFINEYRVAEVCQQLEQKSDRKLIDLALDAGFSSKSSFNAIFKKLTGQTPSLYRRELSI